MIKFTIKIAGLAAEIHAQFPSTKEFCSDYLWDGVPELSVSVTRDDLTFEQGKANREAEVEGRAGCAYPLSVLECTAVQRKLAEELFQRGVLVFHGSAVAVDGQGYLFTAKSGTGKSTHTRLWRECFGERAVMINDDKPFLRIASEGVTVWGSPWSGKHGLNTNMSAPLKAICLLERGAENHISAAAPAEILPMLMQQGYRPMNARYMGKYMELMNLLTSGVAFYRMKCTVSCEAAQMAYETMSGERK